MKSLPYKKIFYIVYILIFSIYNFAIYFKHKSYMIPHIPSESL